MDSRVWPVVGLTLVVVALVVGSFGGAVVPTARPVAPGSNGSPSLLSIASPVAAAPAPVPASSVSAPSPGSFAGLGHALAGLPDVSAYARPASYSPTPAVTTYTYAAAASLAQSAAQSYRAASWNVSNGWGLGLDFPTTETLPLSALIPGLLGCAITWIASSSASLTLSATPSTAPVGTAASYEFSLGSAILPHLQLFAVVTNGSATLLYTETCVPSVGYSPVGTVGVTLDSPAAVAQGSLAGGGAFLAAHPSAVVEWEPVDGYSTIGATGSLVAIPPVWYIIYIAACAPGSISGGSLFIELDGLTGAVLGNYTSACSPAYDVTFTESGLPAGTSWAVGLGGSTNSSTTSTIGFLEGLGSVNYTVSAAAGYAPAPATGTVQVAGTSVLVNITFTAATTYSVTFRESGLAAGTLWSVTAGNISLVSNHSNLVFAETNGSYSYVVTTFGYEVIAPTAGTLTVSGAGVLTNVAFSLPQQYSIDLTETGLPAGTPWGAIGYGSTYTQNVSSSTELNLSVPNGTFYVISGSGSAYFAPSSTTGFLLLTVSGANVTAVVDFVAQSAYVISFNETGLAPATPWEVTLSYVDVNSTATGSSLTFALPNGTYTFTDGGAPTYSASPPNGTITVNGADVSVSITFSAIGGSTTYPVTFVESGLAAGTSWSVTLAGTTYASTTTAVAFAEPNGSWTFAVGSVSGYTATPAGGVTLVNGQAVTEAIVFSVASASGTTYALTFTESGLPSGKNWSVVVAGTAHNTTSASLVLPMPNGTYAFSVPKVASLYPTPATGTVTIQGGPVSRSISFGSAPPTPARYSVTFTETGLPAGTSWAVTLNGTPESSATGTITFSEVNGSYAFSIGVVSGYTASPASGSVGVTGTSSSVAIAFHSSGGSGGTGGTSTATFLGLPAIEGYALVALIAILVAVAVAVLLLRKRGRPGSATSAPPPHVG